MPAQQEPVCVYETESNLVIAIAVDFDITKLKVFLSESTLRLILNGDLYREVKFPVRINPVQGNVSIQDNMIRLEMPKAQDTFVEMTFSKNDVPQ